MSEHDHIAENAVGERRCLKCGKSWERSEDEPERCIPRKAESSKGETIVAKQDYMRALELPWHLAVPLISDFVDDDERPASPATHMRCLFNVAVALKSQLAAEKSAREKAMEIARREAEDKESSSGQCPDCQFPT